MEVVETALAGCSHSIQVGHSMSMLILQLLQKMALPKCGLKANRVSIMFVSVLMLVNKNF